jgi:hypothetical protein
MAIYHYHCGLIMSVGRVIVYMTARHVIYITPLLSVGLRSCVRHGCNLIIFGVERTRVGSIGE